MDEKELIRRSQAGDGEAFGVLVERYKGKVFSLAYGFTRDRVAADDLAQEVFIKAYVSLSKFQAKSEFGTWLYRVAVNHIKDYLRKNKRRMKEIPLEEAGDRALASSDLGPEEQRLREVEREIVQAALARLPEKYRVILTLRDIDGLSYEDISGILKLSPGTVDSRLHRARRKLREKLTGRLGRQGGEYGLS
jgi:RNA polymerase sigma-70 factor (ECF subfamily)